MNTYRNLFDLNSSYARLFILVLAWLQVALYFSSILVRISYMLLLPELLNGGIKKRGINSDFSN